MSFAERTWQGGKGRQMSLERVSIVIVTYKGDEVLTDCLESLAAPSRR